VPFQSVAAEEMHLLIPKFVVEADAAGVVAAAGSNRESLVWQLPMAAELLAVPAVADPVVDLAAGPVVDLAAVLAVVGPTAGHIAAAQAADHTTPSQMPDAAVLSSLPLYRELHSLGQYLR